MLSKILVAISKLINSALLLLIAIYRLCISPFLANRCRFYPSCSSFAKQALNSHNTLIALWLIVKRLLKCHPWHRGGHDPVPTKRINKG